jgi:hypothetical protein
MGPVVGAKLRKNVRNVALDGVLRNAKPAGDLFVRIPGRDQPKHIDLPRTQLVVPGMVNQLGGELRGDSLLAGMDSSDGVQQFSDHVSLQNITPGAGFYRP